MENLMQIVVQETTSSEKQCVVQGGTGDIPSEQQVITYNSLSGAEKTQYDDFVTMINGKTV